MLPPLLRQILAVLRAPRLRLVGYRHWSAVAVPAYVMDFRAHEPLKGWDQAALFGKRVVVIGAGGIGSHVVPALARAGVGALVVVDHDLVMLPNLTRQQFDWLDLGQPKAYAIARQALRVASTETQVDAFELAFVDVVPWLSTKPPDLFIVAPDNHACRRDVAELGRKLHVPVLSVGLMAPGGGGYEIRIQDPARSGGGCAACHLIDPPPPKPGAPCEQNGADIGLALRAAGAVTDAALRLLQPRRRLDYAVLHVVLGTEVTRKEDKIQLDPACPVCLRRGMQP